MKAPSREVMLAEVAELRKIAIEQGDISAVQQIDKYRAEIEALGARATGENVIRFPTRLAARD